MKRGHGRLKKVPKVSKKGKPYLQGYQVVDKKPTTIDKWTREGGQLGSNRGGVFRDEKGEKWYVKFPETEKHARNEMLAVQLYKLWGLETPEVKFIERNGEFGIASKQVDDLKPLKTDEDFKKAGMGYAVDAFLANWDVFGLVFDNCFINSKTGQPFRLDAGGALLFRAQGAPKGDHLFNGDSVPELDTFFQIGNAAKVYTRLSPDEVEQSLEHFNTVSLDEILNVVDQVGFDEQTNKKMKDILTGRYNYINSVQMRKP